MILILLCLIHTVGALQQSALKHWAKNIQDIKGTQTVFNHRAKMCSLAAKGKWSKELENN